MNSPKYNRTPHFHFSPGGTSDDKRAVSIDRLIGVNIVLTEKMDGSNTSLEFDGCYARTHAGPPTHVSFDGLKALHANVKHLITANAQLFGEWCYAKHSIDYSDLPGYFMLFNVRYLNDLCWASWEEVEVWAQEIGVPTVPVLFRGVISSEKDLRFLIENLMKLPSRCGGVREGIVARVDGMFDDSEFSSCVMKYVRANHVQTTEHWKVQEITKNKLKL